MAIMDTPKTLNGYKVIRVEQHKNCSTVMCDAPGKLVVATWWPELGNTWSWGHYYHPDNGTIAAHEKNRQAANADFDETATRNAKR